jgi:formate/nitrite transporter FocA (FNT family)
MAQHSPAEQAESEHRRSPSSKTVYHTVLGEGHEELERPNTALFYSGLAAGLAMGLSLIMEALLREHLPQTPWAPLITKVGYSVGFVVVILGRQQLFTENTLTPMLPLLAHRRLKELLNVLRLWSIILAANLLGTFVIAWALVAVPIIPEETREAILAVAQDSIGRPFPAMFCSAMVAGWLIALIVWLLPYAESSHFWVIMLLTYLIGLGHFPHIIAGAVNVFTLALTHRATWAEIATSFLLPTLLGNIIGGVLLVACLNHAQVHSGKGK